jgi:hypothetical protein
MEHSKRMEELVYKLKSDDGLITNWIEQWADNFVVPLSMHREEKLKELGL